MLQSLGAELLETVEDAAMATHIIVSDGKTKLRRTPKLMICLSKVCDLCHCSHFTPSWPIFLSLFSQHCINEGI